ncbi:MAG: hypothetical protein HC927_09435 [Deltaproteobacteria bacterium]|nr:hypothetical protein [Deltaproteobacteria bacterium]
MPDRDIVLADGVDTAHFKVEVVEGKTLRIKVLSGAVREELHPGAEPLLSE